MNANEVNAVIDNLADKLGLAAGNAAQLVPEFAKYSIATDAVQVLVYGLIVAACAALIIWAERLDPDLGYNTGGVYIVCGIIGVISAAVFLWELSDLVGWLASPQAATVKYILGVMK